MCTFFLLVRTSAENQNILKLETKTTEHKDKNVGKMPTGYSNYIWFNALFLYSFFRILFLLLEQGEDVNYTELNYNVMKPRKVDIDKVDIDQKTEYAVIKLS